MNTKKENDCVAKYIYDEYKDDTSMQYAIGNKINKQTKINKPKFQVPNPQKSPHQSKVLVVQNLTSQTMRARSLQVVFKLSQRG